MKILEEKQLPKSRLLFKLEIPTEKVEDYFKKAFTKLAKSLKLPGFRIGKVPVSLIEKQIGDQGVVQEVLDLLLPEIYYELVQTKKLMPVAAPKVVLEDIPKRGQAFVLGFEIDIYPQINLPDIEKLFKKFKFKKEKVKVEKKEIEKVVDRLLKSYAKHESKNGPVAKGDFVEIDFKGFYADGRAIEGGESRNHPLIVGEGVFVEGFEDNLIGMKEGERKEFQLTFPKNYHKKELAGQKTKFEVELKKVKKVILPKKDDKFALNFGYKTFQELLKGIEENILKEKENEQEKKFRQAIFDFLVDNINFEVPQSLIDEEVENIVHQYAHSLEHQGIDFNDYLEKTGKKIEEIKAGFQEQAEKRVKLGLILNEIAEKQKIDVSQVEIEKEIEKIAKIYNKNVEELKKELDQSSQINSIYLQLKTEKTIEFLKNLLKKLA